MARISLRDVSKRFGQAVVAVDCVSFDVEDKEFVVLVGPSGCGKTTVLRLISGLEDITEGEIFVGDRKINRVPPKDRDIALVFQNYALYPHMNVYKNMAFSLRVRKFPKEEIDRRVRDTAKLLEIDEFFDRKPRELSGGQRQRVAMGRAIVRKPQAFLFDEPLSNLDAKLRVIMRGELAKLHERLETTTIYVTHDQTEAMTLAHRIMVMNQGTIMQIGTPLDVYNSPKNLFVAGFIGSPAMNFLDGALVAESDGLAFRGNDFHLSIPKDVIDRFAKAKDQEVILGIRPEHIYDKKMKGAFSGGESFTARVDVVEVLGSETILLISNGSSHLTARIESQLDVRPHIEMDFLVDMKRMQLFDRSTEEAY